MIAERYTEIHRQNPAFGSSGIECPVRRAFLVELARLQGLGVVTSFFEYGCGKGKLIEAIRQRFPGSRVEGYDTAVPKYKSYPNERFDVVLCLDVLEHIEPSDISDCLSRLRKSTAKICLLLIDHQLATQWLSKHENSHVNLAPPDWWLMKVREHFPVLFSFPTYHLSGKVQKTLIACSQSNALIPELAQLIIPLRLALINGGSLGQLDSPSPQLAKHHFFR